MQAVRKARKSKVEELQNLENWCFQANSISNLIIFSHSGRGLMGLPMGHDVGLVTSLVCMYEPYLELNRFYK